MSIRGTVETGDIERGFSRIKQGFSSTTAHAKSLASDFTRISIVASRLAKGLLALGTVGASSLIGLAMKAPHIAPALAKIKIAAFKLAMVMGEILAPAFNKAAELFERFVGWVQEHPDLFGKITLSTLALVAALTLLKGLSFLIPGGGAVVAGAAAVGAAGAGIYYGGSKLVGALREKRAEVRETMPWTWEAHETYTQAELDQIKSEGVWTPGGRMDPWTEENRRGFLLKWFEKVFG